MKERCGKNLSGTRLIRTGAIIFLIGVTILLFKEFNFPRYWIPAIIGAALMLAGIIVYSVSRVCTQQEIQSKQQ